MNANVITSEDLQEARSALDRPIQLAEGIPGSFYGEDFYAMERKKLFPSTWCVVTVASVIPEAGDMMPIDLAGWPILLVRGRAGEIRAFHNICRHRALQLVATPCRASLIRCPWHEIRHIVFHGLIFITFDADTPWPSAALAKLDAAIAGYRIAELMPSAATVRPIRSNWKLYHEHPVEPDHTDGRHLSPRHAAPTSWSMVFDSRAADHAIMIATGFAGPDAVFGTDAPARSPQIARGPAEPAQPILFAAVLPVLFLVCETGSVLINLALPNGPDAVTRVTFRLYRRGADEREGVTAAAARFTPEGASSWLGTTVPQMNGWLVERYRTAHAIAVDSAQTEAA